MSKDKILRIGGEAAEEEEVATRPVIVRLPEDLIEIIDSMAKEDGITRSEMLHSLLTYGMECRSEDQSRFRFTVKRRPDDRIQVEIEATNQELIYWEHAAAFLLGVTAQRMGIDYDEAIKILCDRAEEFHNAIVPME